MTTAETDAVVARLLRSDEPSIRWRVRAELLGEPVDARPMRALRKEIRDSARVRTIIAAAADLQPYAKWRGAHWALLSLAALGYPPGDAALLPLRDAVLGHWLSPRYLVDRDVPRVTPQVTRTAVPRVGGRSRRCGSQHGGALLAITRLGVDDGRGEVLAARLSDWQWPDGGWNCDRDPAAAMSSVNETLLPMRGLHAFAEATGDTVAAASARAAAEVFLQRRVAWRRRTPGEPIASDVLKLHHPVYWHYDVLAGLVGLAELDMVGDPRCHDAIDHLESLRRPDGQWSATARYWRLAAEGSNIESVPWDTVSTRTPNEWVTLDALLTLKAAGR
ncbi:hypothetical protein [uncultured Microbacterium sp.]|uniref:Uncharacterized protein n=1 Tax=uncultured Microbacterium sp. TaxID=191216 RepID=A0A1Y5P082_9MICO|nr:hypothetical protein [uncultured Microbacterium sp.]SBS72083.1 conserved hypothetical protein [uncultured Microbacterium sp.]